VLFIGTFSLGSVPSSASVHVFVFVIVFVCAHLHRVPHSALSSRQISCARVQVQAAAAAALVTLGPGGLVECVTLAPAHRGTVLATAREALRVPRAVPRACLDVLRDAVERLEGAPAAAF
jgi:hypothetical protein